MNEQEFAAVKKALLETMESTHSEKVKMRCAELLLTLQDRLEAAKWLPLSLPGSKQE